MEFLGFNMAEIGTNGTGKTRKAIEILHNKMMMNSGESFPSYYAILCLVSDNYETLLKPINEITLPETANFKGWAKLEVDYGKIDEVFDFLSENFTGYEKDGILYPSAIFIDDAMAILDTRNESVMRFFKKRRQHLCNVIMNCHGASEFPLALFKNMTDFLIFQTLDSTSKFKERMGSDLVKNFNKTIEYVNRVAIVGYNNQNDPVLSKLKYFNYRFMMKNPPSIESLEHHMRSGWFNDREKVKTILNIKE